MKFEGLWEKDKKKKRFKIFLLLSNIKTCQIWPEQYVRVNLPLGYTIWEILKDTLLSLVSLSIFVQICHLAECVGKTWSYYPINVHASESLAFICRLLISLRHFHAVLRAAPPWCCTTICWGNLQAESIAAHCPSCASLSLSFYNRDLFLCLSLMTLYDCCV